MSRDATETRAKLIRAAERRFARDGVAGARLSAILREAEQANESAVNYHFGSRDGLLIAIVAKHMGRMESRRVEPASGDLLQLVREIVEPTARLLASEDGRDYLRIIDQLSGYTGIGGQSFAEPLRGTILERQLIALQEHLRPPLGRRVADARVATMVLFLTTSLAGRARSVESGRRRPTLGQARYVEELVLMLHGALAA